MESKTNPGVSVTYSSTRGGENGIDFRMVVMKGLARDRGLFVPDLIPTITMTELESWRKLAFAEVAIHVLSKFVKDDQVPFQILEQIVRKACAAFRAQPDVTPITNVGGHMILVRVIFVF
jgi:threonine synthase